ncbi:single-minded homolog 2-like isoform X2 [Portunus trituberculatus]|uniref:single-minded homolog 2-like isoform X2 n=1 Tax=Portunus trituberculatus TaxID=210409 RepID=UPI001E1D2086|nr:single-minded homolog 2-like isoform X2 [Portunus trituberculatus]
MQEIIQMCSFDGTKSTKGASKMRRDMINAEICQLRDLLPLPPSTRQRLSQLQLMALVCVYVRKSNYFQQVFKEQEQNLSPTPNLGFSKAMNGFIMMLTQGGKLLYISDNAAEYLGHSMEDLLIHGDSVYDIIDKQDHAAVQAELVRAAAASQQHHHHHHAHHHHQGGGGGGGVGVGAGMGLGLGLGEDHRLFLCRMNVSRNARRQMRFGDQKVVLVAGHYLSYLPLCSRNEPVFLAHCTPVAMPETRESVVQGATNVFTSVHTLDMKFISLDRNGEFYLGYSRSSLSGVSWYHLLHPENMREAQTKHRLITTSEQDRACILLVRLQAAGGTWRWVHCVLQVKDAADSTHTQPAAGGAGGGGVGGGGGGGGGGSQTQQTQQTQQQATQQQQQQQQPVIVATNQVVGEREAAVLRANAWLYHYYTVHSKLQYGLAYDAAAAHAAAHAAATAHRVHAYYPPVVTYQTDAAAAPYLPSTALTSGASHLHAATPAAAPHPLSSAYAAAQLQHYHHHHHHHHHYSSRQQQQQQHQHQHQQQQHHHHPQTPAPGGLDYPRDGAPAWGSPDAPAHTHAHAATLAPAPAHRPGKKGSSPLASPRRSPLTPVAAAVAEGGGGVAVATPVAVRVASRGTHKGAASPELRPEAPWKASPTQEVPEYPDFSYVTPPYPAAATPTPTPAHTPTHTNTKLHAFTFDAAHDALGRDQRVPSLEAGELPPWTTDLSPHRAAPWLPALDDPPVPLRTLHPAAL